MSEGGQLASSRTRIWTRSPDGCSNTLSAHRKLSLKEHLKSSCLETKGSCELVFLAWLVEPQRSTVRLQVQKEERLWEHSKSRLESGRQLPLLEPLMEASLPVFITRYYRAICREQGWPAGPYSTFQGRQPSTGPTLEEREPALSADCIF